MTKSHVSSLSGLLPIGGVHPTYSICKVGERGAQEPIRSAGSFALRAQRTLPFLDVYAPIARVLRITGLLPSQAH